MSGKSITLVIDGRAVEVPAGTTILEAAARAGVDIPTLCHDPRLPAAEACRLCLVQVDGHDRPLAACGEAVVPGMRVRTTGSRIDGQRRDLFKLMLADHYGDCRAPCTQRCPAGIDIQGYIALIARRQYLAAARLIRRHNPLPMTCGRVCPHPCESQCRRGRVDQPVNINHLKRFCCDIAYADIDALNPAPAPASGKRVAVVGGGPAGLAAAYYLALAGHRPTIFEAADQLGGMLRYGIPAYRLPKDVLDREIEAILRLGVAVRTGQVWGRDFTLGELTERGFDATFLGTGAAVNRELGMIPRGALGVNYGTCFLAQVARGQDTGIGRRVVVIGGGNTAMDCARTAVRLGAEEVAVYYRRSRQEMPAEDIEVVEAEEEGVVFHFCVSPTAIETDSLSGRLSAVTFVRMNLCGIDDSGRPRPEPVAGSEFTVPCDTVIVAVGQVVDSRQMQQDPLMSQVARTKRGTVEVQRSTGATNLAGLYAAGDLVSGPATVIEAIGGGRRAALAIDRFLRGRPPVPAGEFIYSKGTLSQVDPANFTGIPTRPRAEMPCQPPEERRQDFRPVELGLSETQALAEAQRCLACGCQAVDDCRLRQLAHRMGLRQLMVKTRPELPVKVVRAAAPITIEDGKCVVCRRCEQTCADYHGRTAIAVQLDRVVRLDQPRRHRVTINDDCDQCGLCVELCPTGALSYATPWPQPGPLPLEWRESICNLCSLGCRVRVGSCQGYLVRISGAEAPPAHGHLCQWGRFDLARIHAASERITRPLVRRGGSLVEIDWDQAMAELAASLGGIGRSRGPQSLAGLTLGRASLEELYLFGKLVRTALGTNNLDYLDPAADDPSASAILDDMAGGPPLPPYERIEHYPLAILVGDDILRALPLLRPALYRLRQRGGRIILVGRDADLAPLAQEHLALAAGPAWVRAAELLEDAARTAGGGEVLVLGAESSLVSGSQAGFSQFLSTLAAGQSGSVHFGMVPAVPAGRALHRAGISPAHYPGHRRVNQRNRAIIQKVAERHLAPEPGLFAHQILAAAAEGRVKGLIIQGGPNPAWQRISQPLLTAARQVERLVVLATSHGPLVEQAHLVLPKLLCFESGGTYVTADGATHEVSPAHQPPPGTRPDWQVLAQATRALGGPAGPEDLVGVQSEMIVLVQAFAEG